MMKKGLMLLVLLVLIIFSSVFVSAVAGILERECDELGPVSLVVPPSWCRSPKPCLAGYDSCSGDPQICAFCLEDVTPSSSSMLVKTPDDYVRKYIEELLHHAGISSPDVYQQYYSAYNDSYYQAFLPEDLCGYNIWITQENACFDENNNLIEYITEQECFWDGPEWICHDVKKCPWSSYERVSHYSCDCLSACLPGFRNFMCPPGSIVDTQMLSKCRLDRTNPVTTSGLVEKQEIPYSIGEAAAIESCESYCKPHQVSPLYGISCDGIDKNKICGSVVPEICDGVDNDKDGRIDKIKVPCFGGMTSAGVTAAAIGITGMAEGETAECWADVCENSAPSATNPYNIGPVYREADGSFKFEKITSGENNKIGIIVGNNIDKEVRKIIKEKTGGVISDDYTDVKDIGVGFGKTPLIRNYITSNKIAFNLFEGISSGGGEDTCEGKEELPIRKTFYMQLIDNGKTHTSVIKEPLTSEVIETSALFCPNGELQLIKEGGYMYAELAGGVKGKFNIIIKRVEIGVNNGKCYPNIEISADFNDMNSKIMEYLLQYAPAFEAYDIVFYEDGSKEVIYSVMGDLQNLIIKQNLVKADKASVHYLITMKLDETSGNVVVKVERKAERDGKKIPGYITSHISSPNEFKEFIKGLVKKFNNAKIDWSKVKKTKEELEKDRESGEKTLKKEEILGEKKFDEIIDSINIGGGASIFIEIVKSDGYNNFVTKFGKILTEIEFERLKIILIRQDSQKLDVENFPLFKYETQEEAIKDNVECIEDNTYPAWDWYWYYTKDEMSSNKKIHRQKLQNFKDNTWPIPDTKEAWLNVNPLELIKEPVKFQGCDAKKTTWNIFGKKAIEETKVNDLNKPYYSYEEKPEAYKMAYKFMVALGYLRNPLSAWDPSFKIEITRNKIEGKLKQFVIWYGWMSVAEIASKWKLETAIDIGKLYAKSDEILECCPELAQMGKEFKNLNTVKEKTDSIYFILESNENINRDGIAYQFLPPYTFSTEVTKFFNLSLFEYPVYFKEDDSLLENCQYEVLGEVKKVIGPNGGEMVLPDEINNVDKVLEVKEIIPENALDESVEFSIRRINISNCVCHNGVQDDGEEQVDCGGSCEPCVPSCYDDIQNQDETGIDVGGVCTISFISDAEEPCEWDLNKDGKTKACIECTEDKNCSNYFCGGYNPVCEIGKCACLTFDFDYDDNAEFLRLIKNFAKSLDYNGKSKLDETSLSNFLSVVRSWVKKTY